MTQLCAVILGDLNGKRSTSCIRVRKGWARFKYGFCIVTYGGTKNNHNRSTKQKKKIPAINIVDFAHSACLCKKFECFKELRLGIIFYLVGNLMTSHLYAMNSVSEAKNIYSQSLFQK